MNNKIRSIVLVHGAWADGSSWGTVINALNSDGFDVVAAPLPLTSFADDVAALDRVLARIEGPVLLVAHAYAGAVVGAVRSEKIIGLVYVAALAPDEGETVADVFGRNGSHPSAPALAPDIDGSIWLPKNAISAAFAQNLDSDTLEILAAVQRPISISCITVPVGSPNWKTLPSWYFVAEDDRMIAKETQIFMGNRMGARVVSHQTDHLPSLSAPEAVISIVRQAADSFLSKNTE